MNAVNGSQSVATDWRLGWSNARRQVRDLVAYAVGIEALKKRTPIILTKQSISRRKARRRQGAIECDEACLSAFVAPPQIATTQRAAYVVFPTLSLREWRVAIHNANDSGAFPASANKS